VVSRKSLALAGNPVHPAGVTQGRAPVVRWLTAISGAILWLAAAPAPAGAREPGPREVMVSYYSLIAQHNYHAAFRLWAIREDGTNGAGQSEARFATGYRQTRSVSAEVGAEGEGDGAAGTIYVPVPVRVTAHTTSGRTQVFSGQYTLRKSDVKGGDPHWKIHSAKLVQLR
jgi:hypothetical protein